MPVHVSVALVQLTAIKIVSLDNLIARLVIAARLNHLDTTNKSFGIAECSERSGVLVRLSNAPVVVAKICVPVI